MREEKAESNKALKFLGRRVVSRVLQTRAISTEKGNI